MPAEKPRTALITRGPSAVEKLGTGSRTILSQMVWDALVLAKPKGSALAVSRFRIGDYEFCDPDYRQKLQWAKALRVEPEEIVRRMESEKNTFAVIDGKIDSLVWNFELLPITNFEWLSGLSITKLIFKGVSQKSPNLSLRLKSLIWLECNDIGLNQLDLSNVPALTTLDCDENQLTELNLSSVPELTGLKCQLNQLTELDLSNVPALTHLDCRENQLTELNLSNVPALTKLYCENNQLTKLDLSNVT